MVSLKPYIQLAIWSQLEDGTLKNAANLTNDHQLTSISHWLSSL
jgi:hypothetical protein